MSETIAPDVVRSILDPDGIEFRRLDTGDVTDAIAREMLEVFAATFVRWPALDPGVPLTDYLYWKTSNPFTSIAAVQALIDGRIALTTSSWASWVRIGGARRRRVVLLDLAAHPKYQGRGLYSRSVAHRTALIGTGFDLSFHERGSSLRNQSPLKRRGHTTTANQTTRWYRVLRPMRFARDVGRPAIAPIASVASALGRLSSVARRGARRRLHLEIRDETRFDRRFEVLFEEASKEFDVICERSETFLRWRYGDRRAGPFRVRSIGDSDRLFGYAILRLAGAGAFVADLLAVPGRHDVVEALLADATSIARAAGAASVECWLANRHPYRKALRRQGFVDSRAEVVLEYHAVGATTADLAPLSDPRARIHFLIGDTDLV